DSALTLQEPGKKDAATTSKMEYSQNFMLPDAGEKDKTITATGTLDFTGGNLTIDGGTLVLNHATAPSPALTKASQIILPTVSFREATVEQALDFLRVKAKELDPAKEGVNIVLK